MDSYKRNARTPYHSYTWRAGPNLWRWCTTYTDKDGDTHMMWSGADFTESDHGIRIFMRSWMVSRDEIEHHWGYPPIRTKETDAEIGARLGVAVYPKHQQKC